MAMTKPLSEQVRFTQDGTGAVERLASEKLKEWVSVKDFGAVGDGVADDTAAIQAAADAAFAAGKPVYAPAGVYKLTAQVVFRTGLVGDGKTRTKFQAVNDGTKRGEIFSIQGSGMYEQFWVDGDVSADPPAWNSSNFDSFTGWAAIYVRANDVQVKSVKATNTLRAGFAVWGQRDVAFYDCDASRARGKFGDCFFVYYGAKNISHINCRAFDFTRIGFVFDGSSPAAAVSRNCTYINCHAEFGHDSSVLYGDSEYNAGFWVENCAEVTFDACTSRNTGSRGFEVAAGTGGTELSKTPNFVFNACAAENLDPPVPSSETTLGFLIGGIGSAFRASAILNACSTKNILGAGFESSGNMDATFNNCAFYGDGGGRLTWVIGCDRNATATINGFYQHWTNRPIEVASSATGDMAASISNFNSGTNQACKGVEVNNYKTHDGSPCYIKHQIYLDAVTNQNYLTVRNTKVSIPGLAHFAGNIVFENCEIERARLAHTSKTILFKNCRFNLTNSFNIEWYDELESCVFDSCVLTRVSNQFIYLYRLTGSTDKTPRFKFNNCTFIGNVETNSYFVRQGAEGSVFNNAGQGHFYSHCVFVNTGGATSNPVIQWDATGYQAGRVHMVGCWKSASISSVVKTGWLWTGSVVNNLA